MTRSENLRHACRRLRSAPMFTLFSIVTLAVGIGATTAVYSLIRAVTGPPPGVSNPNSLVEVYHYPTGSGPMVNVAWEDYQDLKTRQSVFESLAGWSWFRAAMAANGRAEAGGGEVVDGDYFRTLGVRAEVGRLLQPADDRPDASPVVVISAALWRRFFDGASDVVGRTIKINGTTFHVVGVIAPEFTGLFNGGLLATHVWVSLNTARSAFTEMRERFASDSRNRRWLFVHGRLWTGVSMVQAQNQIAAIGQQLDAQFPIGADLDVRLRRPYNVGRPWGVRAVSGRLMGVPERVVSALSGMLMGAVVLVWLIACTNLANLMLARHSRRYAETAVRRALGASRWRLAREAMWEPLILAIAGGLGGLAVPRVLMRVFSTELPLAGGPTLQVLPRLDFATLSVGVGVTLLALLVAGLVPALHSTRVDLRSTLATDAAGAVPRWRGRRYLIAAQVAVSVVLVSLATLYAGELRRQGEIDTGMDLERLALAHVDFGSQKYEEHRARQIADSVLGQMAARPGVAGVALMSGLPAGLTTHPGASLTPVGGSSGVFVAFVSATPGVFDTLGVAITRGRAFDRRDTQASRGVVVLSELAAQQLFGTSEAIGREVVFQRRRYSGEPEQPPKTLTVVGLVSDTDAHAGGRGDVGVAYLPTAQHYESNMVVALRATGDLEPFVGQLRTAIASVDPALAITQAGTGLSLAGPDMIFPGIVAGLAGLLGGTALVLALVGLYGVLSHVVAGRTREIGVRLALGAGMSTIRRMIIREGLKPLLVGLMAGLGLGVLARSTIQPLLFGIVPNADLRLMALVPALFIAAGLAACYLPARRASRVDPNVALRNP